MRTTLTIDDDLAVQIERLRRDREATLKDVINEALRRGLHEMTVRKNPRKLFYTEPLEDLIPRMSNMDNISEVVATSEGETFK